MKPYVYIPIVAVLFAVFLLMLTAIFPMDTLTVWGNGLVWLVAFLLHAVLTLILLVVILCGAFLLGGFALAGMDYLNTLTNKWLHQRSRLSGFQHFLVGALAGGIIGTIWVIGVPYLANASWSWVGNAFAMFWDGYDGLHGPSLAWGIVAALEAWAAYWFCFATILTGQPDDETEDER